MIGDAAYVLRVSRQKGESRCDEVDNIDEISEANFL